MPSPGNAGPTTPPAPSRGFGRLTIARKLPLVIVVAALLSATAVGITSYYMAAGALRPAP